MKFADIDDEAGLATYEKNIGIIRQRYTIKETKRTISRGGLPGMHIYLEIEGQTLSNAERIAIQAILGSDLQREAYSLIRMWTTTLPPTIFFEKPENGELPPAAYTGAKPTSGWV